MKGRLWTSSNAWNLVSLRLRVACCRIYGKPPVPAPIYESQITIHPTKNCLRPHNAPFPPSLSLYYYLKYLLSFFNSYLYIYKYRGKRERGNRDGGGDGRVRRASE
jgi:hypothetical protein